MFIDTMLQTVASGIPTSASLELTSNPSNVPPGARSPPKNVQQTETKLQRDEWMLLDPGTPTVPVGTPSRPPARAIVQTADEMTDGFGEELTDARNLGGGVDFFSSLGTEHRKKPSPKDVNAKVCQQLLYSLSQLNTDYYGILAAYI